MKYEFRPLAEPDTFEQFAERHSLTMVVRERPMTTAGDASNRYYASFEGVEISDGTFLHGIFGDGPTPEAAIRDYGKRLCGQRLIVDAWGANRREIQCPNEWQ